MWGTERADGQTPSGHWPWVRGRHRARGRGRQGRPGARQQGLFDPRGEHRWPRRGSGCRHPGPPVPGPVDQPERDAQRRSPGRQFTWKGHPISIS